MRSNYAVFWCDTCSTKIRLIDLNKPGEKQWLKQSSVVYVTETKAGADYTYFRSA